MFSAFCLIATAVILAFILKFRVHVHVIYTPTGSLRACPPVARKAKGGTGTPGPARPIRTPWKDFPQTFQDISAMLVGQGLSKAEARKIAEKVCRQYPNATVDQLVRIAIQEAA